METTSNSSAAASPDVSDAGIAASLKRWFRHESFRPGQLEAIRDVLSGRDTLVVMPTGSGKSVCFQLPAMMLPGATLVVSPLISLMKDQVDALSALGIPAAFVNSSLSAGEVHDRLEAIASHRLKLIYVAPERFRNPGFVDAIRKAGVSMVAIDEAHCICQWGYDFRPDYLNLRDVVGMFPGARVMAVTATATPEVRRDIVVQLGMGASGRMQPSLHVHGFGRPNLRLEVLRCPTHDHKFHRIERLIEDCGPGIIYVATRKQAERVFERLEFYCAQLKRRAAKSQGSAPRLPSPSPIIYHGALSDEARTKAQETFASAACPVVVATNAFGMGIDRADIRFVAHWDIPGSIEAYYQEIGRAGRDGLPSTCVLLFNFVDVKTQEFFIEAANPSRAAINSMLLEVKSACAKGPVARSADSWADAAGLKNGILARNILAILERAGAIKLERVPGSRETAVYLEDGFDRQMLEKQLAALEHKRAFDEARLDAMVRYADYRKCRHSYILDYFGEEPPKGPCGACDSCLARAKAPPLDPSRRVVVSKVLSCVARMKGRFGPKRVCQVLIGDSDPYLEEKGLNALSTFGILREYRQQEISRILDELAAAGCVEVSGDQYHLVSITEKGIGVAKNRPQFAAFSMPWPISR